MDGFYYMDKKGVKVARKGQTHQSSQILNYIQFD